MSQTLNLLEGKYALFITPPQPGVDFSGTPTPVVTYQWRKNGTAISGQTAATISGVWVDQVGGTVSLVDGDVISIDVILTNPVQVTIKTIAATISTAQAAPVSAPVTIRQLVGNQYVTVTSLANTDIGEQVIVASNTGGTVTTTPPTPTTYQWRRGFGPIAGATSQAYTLQAADADSIIDCVVTATNSGGTVSRTATVIVGTVASVGWTELAPSSDSRLIYVASTGNDAAALSAKGRGYYLPSDPEIGADPTNPVGPIVAYQSMEEAAKMFRGRSYTGDRADGFPNYVYNSTPDRNGFPDWMLFRRGQSFTAPTVSTAWGMQVRSPTGLAGSWFQQTNQFSYQPGGPSGRSESEPAVITAWGPASEPRPVFDAFGISGGSRNMAIVSIEVAAAFAWDPSKDGNTADNLLVEDCKARSLGTANTANFKNGRFRRCVVTSSFSPSSHNQGFFIGGNDSLVIEECVFDMNGYKEDPLDPSTWTRGVAADGLPVGQGVQPKRTYFDRNMYLSSYESMTLRGNIISRGGGGSSVQMREGGIAERNVFMWCDQALGTAHPETFNARMKPPIVKDNLVLHDDHMLPPGGFGIGLQVGGSSDSTAVLDGNIVAHFHRRSNGGGACGVSGKGNNSAVGKEAQPLQMGIVINNDVFLEFGASGLSVASSVSASGVLSATISGNEIRGTTHMSIAGDSSRPSTHLYEDNRLSSASATPFRIGSTDLTLAQWQAAGYDSDAYFASDFATFKTEAGWTAPERDIVSYMQSIDPSYINDEDVTTDYGVPVEKRRPNAQRVWEVLSDPAIESFFRIASVDQAKLTARRYHAFITFSQRAKANRKGAWDTRYTAEALNNYIRAGFGKAAVTGAYDTRSLADRLQDYTT